MQNADNTARLFVSHSHEDDPFCLRLIADLRARLGEEAVWYDTSGGLHGSDDWWDRIIAEISERPYFLVVLSPHASESRWVPQEMKIAFRQHVELGKRLLPVRLAPSPRRPDWESIQEFDFTHADDPASYANALAELMRMFPKDPASSAMPVSIAVGVQPDRPLSATERLAREAHGAYAREHWSDVLDKTEILVERGAMTPALWRERASAAFALNDNKVGLAVIKQALKVGAEDSDTLLLYVRLTTKAGDDEQAVEILTRAYALVSLDDTTTRLVILGALTAALARLDRWDDFERRVSDARRIAPNDLPWALREVEMLLIAGLYGESVAAARSLPTQTDSTALLPAWRSTIQLAAQGPAEGENWLVYRALLEAAAATGVDASAIAQWKFEFPHFVSLVVLSTQRHAMGNPVWSPNGVLLAIPTDLHVEVWDTASGTQLCTLLSEYYLDGRERGLAWSPDSKRLATAGVGAEHIWDATSGQLLATLHLTAVAGIWRRLTTDTTSQGILSSGAWSPNGAWVATTGGDVDVLAKIWDAASGRLVTSLPSDRSFSEASVAWSPSGALLATASSSREGVGNVVQIWEVAKTRLLANLADCDKPIAWSPDGARLAVGSKDGILVWDVPRARPLITLADETISVYDVAWSADGTRLVICWHDKGNSQTPAGIWSHELAGIRTHELAGIWDVATGRQIARLSDYGSSIRGISWSSDGRRLVGFVGNEVPMMWDSTSGQGSGGLAANFRALRRRYGTVLSRYGTALMAWAPGGDRLADASGNGVIIWGEE